MQVYLRVFGCQALVLRVELFCGSPADSFETCEWVRWERVRMLGMRWTMITFEVVVRSPHCKPDSLALWHLAQCGILGVSVDDMPVLFSRTCRVSGVPVVAPHGPHIAVFAAFTTHHTIRAQRDKQNKRIPPYWHTLLCLRSNWTFCTNASSVHLLAKERRRLQNAALFQSTQPGQPQVVHLGALPSFAVCGT